MSEVELAHELVGMGLQRYRRVRHRFLRSALAEVFVKDINPDSAGGQSFSDQLFLFLQFFHWPGDNHQHHDTAQRALRIRVAPP